MQNLHDREISFHFFRIGHTPALRPSLSSGEPLLGLLEVDDIPDSLEVL
jgi:hypothetical protein